MKVPDLTYRRLDERDTHEVLALLTATLGGGPTGRRSAEFFAWKHHANPFGPSPGLLAQTPDGEIVGVRLFLRWEWRDGADGRTVRAVRPVDTATHPAYQRRGIFRRLTTDLLEQVREDAELVFNTPNSRSLPGYLRMGWQRIGRVPPAIRPIRPASFARGLRAALDRRASFAPAGRRPCPLPTAAAWFAQDPYGLAELLYERAAADRADQRLATVRSAAFLRWRYADAPGLDYRVLTCHRGRELAGLAIGRPRMRGSLTEFTLAEVIVRPGDRGSAARLLRAAAGSGADHVATHLAPGTEAAEAALRCGYLPAPRTGMTLVGRRSDGSPLGLGLPAWRFSLGDLEVF